MNLKKKIAAIALFVCLTGCTDFVMVCSLNPFYLDKNVVILPESEGDWSAVPVHVKPDSDQQTVKPVWNLADTTCLWRIKRVISKETIKTALGKDSTVLKPLDRYEVKLVGNPSDSAEYEFRLVFFRVKNRLYGDFTPAGNKCLSESRMATESYFTVHSLARVVMKGDRIELSWLGAEYTKEMIEKKRVRLNYRWVPGAKRLLLTGSSEQLTAMIDHYAGEKRFIDWDSQPAIMNLHRINK